jgi:serine/threonine protein kinase
MEPIQIGHGSYGSVFRPPIGSHNDSLIGKVMFNDYIEYSSVDTDIEWAQRDILYIIDPHQSHFLYPLNKQQIDVVEYNKYTKDPIECKDCTMWQLTMYDGGLSVRQQGEKGMLSVFMVLHYTIQMAQSIKRLLHNDLVHLDLHLGNVVSKDNRHCKVIDFGLMLRAKMFYTDANPAWTFQYAVNPPEMRLIQPKDKHHHSMKYEQELLAKYIGIDEDNLQHIFVNPAFILSYEHLKTTMMEMSEPHKRPKKTKLQYLKSINAHEKTDVYALGVALIEMLSYTDDKDISVDVVLKVWDIITRMLMPHPNNRICIDALIYELTGLMKHVKI